MTVGEFKTLVRRMRAAQRECVENGNTVYWLRACAGLEREVDEAIEASDARAAAADDDRAEAPADLFGGATGSTKPGHAQ